MGYKFNFRPYQRQLKQPLQTSHGQWQERQGIILRLIKQQQVSFGEIAPLPWFGSESFEQAWEFCHQLPSVITAENIQSISVELPACQFGLGSAWQRFDQEPLKEPSIGALSALLPTGAAALQAWQSFWCQGHHTFKWKIGVAPLASELVVFQQLTAALPTRAKLRLDANGGLTQQAAEEWLQVCDALSTTPSSKIEFLEQPLPPAQLDVMLELSSRYATPLALDESVATLKQLIYCFERGWRGVFVIKPAIAGSPIQLREFCQEHPIDAVFSSVLETAIGRQAGLQLAAELANPRRALGYGVDHWFTDDGFSQVTATDFEQLWQTL